MKTMRILGAACAGILLSSIGTLTACSNHSDAKDESVAQTVNKASVTIALTGEDGAQEGTGSGVLLAPQLVLTSGHLISGRTKWVVTAADGTKVTASRGLTYDWRMYTADQAHPRRNDVGILYLDKPIKLSAYPRLADSRAAEGSLATRLHNTGARFEAFDITLHRDQGAPNSYLTDFPGSETLNTGAPVVNKMGI